MHPLGSSITAWCSSSSVTWMAGEQYLDMQARSETLVVVKKQLSVMFTMNVKQKPEEHWSQLCICLCILRVCSRAEGTDGSVS